MAGVAASDLARLRAKARQALESVRELQEECDSLASDDALDGSLTDDLATMARFCAFVADNGLSAIVEILLVGWSS